MANSVDLDQTPCSAASDQGLHCLLSLSIDYGSSAAEIFRRVGSAINGFRQKSIINTLHALGKSADDIGNIFLTFSQKIGFDGSHKLSP